MERLRPLILFEAIVVVVMWTSAILVPISLIDRVHQTLPNVYLDPSVELRILSSVLLLALEVYVRRMLGDLFRGIGFQPYNAPRHYLFTVVWRVIATVIPGPTLRDSGGIHRQGLLSLLYHSVSNHSEESPAKLEAPDATLPPMRTTGSLGLAQSGSSPSTHGKTVQQQQHPSAVPCKKFRWILHLHS